jgi:mannose-6-phosphate isomerase
VRTGDAAFIPAGRVHAILPGTLLLEIQQNSDTTYRLYDWGRVGLDGQPRPLHIADGLAVTDWHDIAPALEGAYPLPAEGNRHVRLAACPFFVVDRHDLTQPRQFSQDGSAFRILNVVGGHATLHWAGGAETLGYGDTLLLPAMLGPWHLIPEGAASVVVSYVP